MTGRDSIGDLERRVEDLDGGPIPRPPTVCEVLSAETIEPTADPDVYRVDGECMEIPGGVVGWLAGR